ncbi:SDR family oxidoreductase [Phenylobacterium sp.]|uniref:SDR family oxidoreductase n=1 Tax=Phenylobacterium sp. TaxID=1871053 RepID=UPI003BAA14EA
MKALVLGASGFVGRRVLERLGPERGVGAFASQPIAGGVRFLAGQDRFANVLSQLPGDLTHVFILYGAIDPERCARDWDGTAAINIDSVLDVAGECFRQGLTPVFFSSDYVFPGSRGFWSEDDSLAPLTAYGRQKAAVETWLARQTHPWLVVRLSKVVSDRQEPQNILWEWIRNIRDGQQIRCASDQVLCPLAAEDAAGVSVGLAEGGATGLFNVAGPEAFTRLALLRLLLTQVVARSPGAHADIVPCRLRDLPFSEERPIDTSLDISKLQRALGWPFAPMTSLCSSLASQVWGPGDLKAPSSSGASGRELPLAPDSPGAHLHCTSGDQLG